MCLLLATQKLKNSAALAYTRPFREEMDEEEQFGKEKTTWYSIEGIDK